MGDDDAAATVRTAKAPTGILGLDDILLGGVPEGCLTLLSGGPGTGKTVFALEFLVRGALAGRPGVFLTFEEREESLRRYASNFGWNVGMLEAQNRLSLIAARFDPDAILSGEFDLGSVLAILRHKTETLGARQVVIDAPDVFLRLMDNPARERAALYKLNDWLRDHRMTALTTVKETSHRVHGAYDEFLDYMADCVIQLDQRVNEQVTTRRLRVAKYRGAVYGRNEYPFGVTDTGIRVIPITQTNLRHSALGPAVSSGVPGLDALIDGGYRRGSCTLISGTSGAGKTTFACSFVRSTAESGEKLLYLDFEESWEAIVSCMVSPGIDLRPAQASNLLRFLSTMPESQGVEEHLIQAFRVIEEFQPAFLVVDAISACRRMGSRHAAFDYLLRLIDHCKVRGITSLLTNLTTNRGDALEVTGIDLSSVIDTVIVLRNVESQGCFRRELAILKSRGRSHSNKVHEFAITDEGVRILGVKEEKSCHDAGE